MKNPVNSKYSFSNDDRILVIGGTGFIGRHLVKRCLKDTPNVTVLSLNDDIKQKSELGSIKVISSDINDKARLAKVLKGEYFNYVFNLGGYIEHTPYKDSGRSVIETHLIGLMNIVDCLEQESLKSFVQIGSSDEYGNSNSPQKETLKEIPFSTYSFAKGAATNFIKMLYTSQGFPGTVVRLFLVFGPGQDSKRFLPQIITGCLNDETIKTTKGEQIRDFCYVNDAVEGLIRSAISKDAKGKVINLASGKPVTVKSMVEKVVMLVGKGKPIFGARPYRDGESMKLYADVSLAKELLEWEPATKIDDALIETIGFYRNN